jgi:hypothetical protein
MVLTMAFVDFVWPGFVVSGEVAIAPIALPMGAIRLYYSYCIHSN